MHGLAGNLNTPSSPSASRACNWALVGGSNFTDNCELHTEFFHCIERDEALRAVSILLQANWPDKAQLSIGRQLSDDLDQCIT